MTLDVHTAALLEQMAAARGQPLHESTPEQAREQARQMAAMAGPAPTMRSAEDHPIDVDGGSITVRVLVPPQGARGVIVYLHGGGWVVGDIDSYDTLARKLAERTSCAVMLPEYRLAPEHPYPTAVNDSDSALVWAAARKSEIAGRSDVPLIVAGDSAGGNLAAVLARRARDRGGPSLALQILIYPVTDADFDRPSYTDPENQLLVSRESMPWFWDHYAPDPVSRREPDASPLRAENLKGLAPAMVMTAEHDVLRDEGEAYAMALREAGVPVDWTRYAGQTHGFFSLLALPGSERGFQQFVRAVRACLASETRRRTAVAPA